jgi:hypothetical protein
MATSRSEAETAVSYDEFNVPYRIAWDLSKKDAGRPSEAEVAAIALALWKLLPPAVTGDSNGNAWARIATLEGVSQRF